MEGVGIRNHFHGNEKLSRLTSVLSKLDVSKLTTAHESDETIKMDVVEQLYWDERFDAADISVIVEEGTVTLEGSVPTYFAKHTVVNSILSVAGVKDVENNLDVSETPTSQSIKDEEILNRVRQTLSWDMAINSTQIDVSVSNGTVTLEGTVNQVWKRHRAEEETAELDGVFGVVNEITVVPTEDIEDRILAREIIKAFERNPYVTPDTIDVTVMDQVVTLGGEVGSSQTRGEALDIVRKTAGVKRIENNLQIAHSALADEDDTET